MATEAPAQETPVPAPEAPAPDAPTASELMSTIEAERIARLQTQQENERLRASMYMQRPQPSPQQQSPGLDSVVSNFITDPQQAAQGLQSHIQNSARMEAERAARQAAMETEARMRMAMENERNASLIQNAQMRYPEFQNKSVMVGAVAQAVAEAQEKGLVLPNEQIIERAARIVRQGKPAAPAPYVEGSGAGTPVGSPANAPQQQPQKSELERMYGAKAGSLPSLGDIDWTEYTAKFVQAENAERFKHGMLPTGKVMQRGLETEDSQ